MRTGTPENEWIGRGTLAVFVIADLLCTGALIALLIL